MMKRKLLSISILYIATMLAGIGVNAQITTWDELYNAFQNGGDVTLSQDITTYSGSKGALIVPSKKTVTLDLNGFAIDRKLSTKTKKGSVIQVKGTLIINDSKGGGKITGGFVDREKDTYDGGGGLYIYAGGKVTLNSGSICGNKSYGKGPGVLISPGAEMTMNGGSISYNENTRLDNGGGVYVQGSSSGGAVFTMYDGEISHNIGGNGGGVYIDGESSSSKAVFELHGGTICYNDSYGWGGGICARSDGYFYMYGGYVFDNHAYMDDDNDDKYGRGGGIYLESKSHVYIEISGTTKMGIYENTAEVEGDDIESNNGANLNLISPEQMTKADGNIFFGGKVKWITDVKGKRFKEGKGSVSSIQSGTITNGASLAISIPCPWCDLQDQIDAVSNGDIIKLTYDVIATNSEHYHYFQKKNSDEHLVIPTGKKITIDLNGHTIDRNLAGSEAKVNGNVFTVAEGASLTITDSSKDAQNPYGKGVITGGNNNSSGGGIYVLGTCTFECGSIIGNSSTSGGGISNEGVLSITGGKVTGNSASGNGQGIYQKGTMNLSGNPSFGSDQYVYLPAGADAAQKSQYVITKVGNFSEIIPIKPENEVIGRDILVSKANATSSSEGKVVDSDLEKLIINLLNSSYISIYNPEGLESGAEPKDVIELSVGILVSKSGLKIGESAAFSICEKGKPAKAVNIILTGVDNEGTAVSQTVSVAFSATEITVKELPWSWAYTPEGDTEKTQDITTEGGNVFTFVNEEKDKTPLHSEAVKNNSVIGYEKGSIIVDVEAWKNGGKRKIKF